MVVTLVTSKGSGSTSNNGPISSQPISPTCAAPDT
jgi:hypothetical protein